jgi:branched-chain amino acid transport system substrate-binding protein
MMKKKNGKHIARVSTAMLIISACMLFFSESAMAAEPKEIKIGLIYSLSGPVGAHSRDAVNGHELALEEVNEKGGIKSLGGAKLKYVIGDSENKPEVGMSVVEKMITQDHVVALMGPYESAMGFAVTQVAEKYKTPIIIPLAVADQITERGFKYTFRTSFKASTCAGFALDFMKWVGDKTGIKPKTVALLYEDTLFGQSAAKAWKELIPKYRYDLVSDLPYSKATQDISPTISKLKAAKPDVILQTSYVNDAVLITRTMFELDFNCMGIIPMGGGQATPEYPKALGKLVDYVILNMIYHPSFKGPGNRNEIENQKYNKKYGHDMDDNSGPAYDTTWVLADALERAGSIDRQKVRDAIAATNINIHNSPVLRPYQFKFDASGQAPATGIFTQFQNEKLMAIWPEEYSSAKVVWPMPTWKQRGLR